jgi:2-dehydro-3-deoxyglucarate aldolase/4-hydroxy-2-oxoheptanedioate aldolase
VLASVQIETLDSLKAVEDIAAVDGMDVLFVGPGDLHAALGLFPRNDSDEPDFQAALKRIVEAGRKHGKPIGTLCMTVEAAHKRIEQGFTFIALGNDMGHLLNGAKAALTALGPQ